MESAPIPDQKNVSTDSGVTFLHPCDYSYQHYDGDPYPVFVDKMPDYFIGPFPYQFLSDI